MSASKLFRRKRPGKFGRKDVLFTEDEYREALKRFLEISEAPENSEEAEELEHLMMLLELYEKDNCS